MQLCAALYGGAPQSDEGKRAPGVAIVAPERGNLPGGYKPQPARALVHSTRDGLALNTMDSGNIADYRTFAREDGVLDRL